MISKPAVSLILSVFDSELMFTRGCGFSWCSAGSTSSCATKELVFSLAAILEGSRTTRSSDTSCVRDIKAINKNLCSFNDFGVFGY